MHSQTVRVDKMESGDPAGSSHSNPSQLPCLEPLDGFTRYEMPHTRFYESWINGTSHSDSGFTLPAVGEKRDRHTWNVYDESTLGELVEVKKEQSGYCTSEVLAEEDVATKSTLPKKRRYWRVGRNGRVRRDLAGKWVAESRDLGKGSLRLGTFDTEEEATIALRAAAKLNFADGQIPSTISTLASASATPLEEHKIPTSEAIEMGLKIIREVEKETKTVVVNREQCKSLSLVYHEIGLFIEDVKETIVCNESKTFGPFFSEIMRVMRKGRYLILLYATHDWYKSVVSWGVNWEAFEDVHSELQRCIECLHSSVPELEKISPHFQALVYRTWTEDLKSDAKLDNDHILAKLSREQIRLERTTNEKRKERLQDLEHPGIRRDQGLRLLQVATEKVKENEEQLTANKGDRDEKLPTYLQIHSSDIILGKRIGSGAFGEVHEAIWLNCKFAVKLIKTDDVSTLRREVGILSRLRHPHIIQLVGFSVSQTMSMIVMEKMDGDLHHLIEDCSRKPPFALPKAVNILSQIAAGMAYLHDQGVFHGDLKASNVLVSRKGHLDDIEVKISDFGVSQHVKLERRLETSKDLVEEFSSPGSTTSREHPDVYSGSSFSGTVGTTCWRAPEVFPLQFQKTNDIPLQYQKTSDFLLQLQETNDFVLELQKTNDHNSPISKLLCDLDFSEDLKNFSLQLQKTNDLNSRVDALLKAMCDPDDSDDSDVPKDLKELFHTAISNPTFLSEAHNKDAMEDPVKKEPSYTAKADVYSYAMTCYEVLTGLSPFADYVRSTLYEKLIAGARPELPMNLPPSLSSLIKACWDTDPGQRPTFTTICEELRNMQQFIRAPSALSLLHDSLKSSCTIS